MALWEGWNWVGFAQLGQGADLNEFWNLAAAGPTCSYMKGQWAIAAWFEDFGFWGSVLNAFEPFHGYKLFCEEATELSWPGIPVTSDVTIVLDPGWNWFTAPYDTVTEVANTTSANVEFISSQTAFTQYYEGYGFFGSMTAFHPNRMYKAKAGAEGGSIVFYGTGASDDISSVLTPSSPGPIVAGDNGVTAMGRLALLKDQDDTLVSLGSNAHILVTTLGGIVLGSALYPSAEELSAAPPDAILIIPIHLDATTADEPLPLPYPVDSLELKIQTPGQTLHDAVLDLIQVEGPEALNHNDVVAWVGNVPSGCTDVSACNYEFGVWMDDGSCLYEDSECGTECGSGDMDGNGALNVNDVVLLVSLVLGDPIDTDMYACAGDVTSNTNIDVLDIVKLVALVMEI